MTPDGMKLNGNRPWTLDLVTKGVVISSNSHVLSEGLLSGRNFVTITRRRAATLCILATELEKYKTMDLLLMLIFNTSQILTKVEKADMRIIVHL